ncbi:hypothetical protein CEXT_98191 [Caerostris extrusa]|uniref:Uncharacterized protein n=1 Tax=Caerostris extrusa TaxID=172846 RepID=A0AAV4W0Y2_CAEEX|nr:hypothetical protein CEXT_98191 [Caerostris extrusa]
MVREGEERGITIIVKDPLPSKSPFFPNEDAEIRAAGMTFQDEIAVILPTPNDDEGASQGTDEQNALHYYQVIRCPHLVSPSPRRSIQGLKSHLDRAPRGL